MTGVVALTLQVAALATLVILPPGVLAAWALARPGWRGRLLFETVLTLPLVLPPTAVGFALLVLLGPGGLGLGESLAFTTTAAVVAAAVVALPLLVRPLRAAFEEVDPRRTGVARTLGHGPWGVFWRVQLPLAWRGLVAGGLLAFARALGEFGATIVVAGNIPGRTQTLALAIFQAVEVGREQEAARLVGVAALLAFLLIGAAELIGRRRSRRLGD
jgi:molybdate transport system permease protein